MVTWRRDVMWSEQVKILYNTSWCCCCVSLRLTQRCVKPMRMQRNELLESLSLAFTNIIKFTLLYFIVSLPCWRNHQIKQTTSLCPSSLYSLRTCPPLQSSLCLPYTWGRDHQSSMRVLCRVPCTLGIRGWKGEPRWSCKRVSKGCERGERSRQGIRRLGRVRVKVERGRVRSITQCLQQPTACLPLQRMPEVPPSS